MAKIPFSIDYRPQIESGEYKVVCGDSCCPVSILMWDFKDPEGYCILGYYEDKEGQHAVMYNNSGKLYHDKESMFDLFIIIPEPELTEFEQSVRDCIIENLTTHGREMSSTVFVDDDTAKKMAAELRPCDVRELMFQR